MTTINETRCERTDLPASMCSHCRGLPWVAPAVDPELDPFSAPAPPMSEDRDRPGPWFVSRYGDNCATCGGDIIPGDTIRAVRNGYECGDCGDRGGRQ